MSDVEILEAMRQMLEPINTKLERLENETQGIKLLLDTEIRRDIKTIAEGHQVILDRLPEAAKLETIETRLSAVEVVVKKHSKDIQDLKRA